MEKQPSIFRGLKSTFASLRDTVVDGKGLIDVDMDRPNSRHGIGGEAGVCSAP